MKSRLSYSLKETFLIDQCLLGRKGAVLEPLQWFHLNSGSSCLSERGPWPAAKVKKQEIHSFTGAWKAKELGMLSFLKRYNAFILA